MLFGIGLKGLLLISKANIRFGKIKKLLYTGRKKKLRVENVEVHKKDLYANGFKEISTAILLMRREAIL